LLAIVATPPSVVRRFCRREKNQSAKTTPGFRLRSRRKILKLRTIFIATDDCRADRSQRIINLKN
jgi:hypothetical protein